MTSSNSGGADHTARPANLNDYRDPTARHPDAAPLKPPPKYPNRVKELRMASGLSPRQVAERSGIPVPTYFGIQQGRLPLSQERAEAIAKVFDVDPKTLAPAPLQPAEAIRSRKGRGGHKLQPAEEQDLEKLLAAALNIPKRRRKLAADMLTLLKRAWE